MKQKIKYFILLPLLMLSILPILLTKEKTKASYLNLVLLNSGTIEELPDEDLVNGWQINKWLFAKFNYGTTEQYLLNYYDGSGNNVLFISYKFIDETHTEFEDDEIWIAYNDDLKTLLTDLKLLQMNINGLTTYNPKYFIQYDYQDCIGYWDTTMNYPVIYSNYYSGNYSQGIVDEYIEKYGILNTIYQQHNFYQYIISYLKSQSSELSEDYEEQINQYNNYYQGLINDINNDWQENYNADIEESYLDGFANGRIYEREHPTTDPNSYTLEYMFNVISLYPIRFFKEGLNVQLFGIDIGNLLLGIFMIGLLIIILRMILGIIRGNK